MLALIKALAFFMRHSPAPLRHWRIELLAIRLSKHLQHRLPERAIRTEAGFSLLVDGESQAGRILYATGRYEEAIATVLKRILRPGDTFVDGGAHIGVFAVLGSRCVGPTGKVFAFEPAEQTRQTLTKNLLRNGCANTLVRPEALGRAEDRADLVQLSAGQTGHATLRRTSSFVSSEQVSVIALDSLRPVLGPVRAVKLDLEGLELEALRGMTQIIQACHPDIIVEVTDKFLRASRDGSALMLYRFLTGFGYAAHVIEHEGLTAVSSENRWQALPDQFNALFTAKDTLPASLPCA
jgi:FkbM family methyltransferase